jgi:protein-S-isoprenylcysteine O-methyltransferase Ste14
VSSRDETAGVIAPPPLIYLAGLGLGFALDAFLRDTPIPAAVQWTVGPALVLIGLTLMRSFLRSFHRADTAVRPDRPTSALVADGPYRFTRNPAYLGMAIVCSGIVVWSSQLWAFIGVFAAVVVIDRGVIAREERYLTARFGAEYESLRARVRRWL